MPSTEAGTPNRSRGLACRFGRCFSLGERSPLETRTPLSLRDISLHCRESPSPYPCQRVIPPNGRPSPLSPRDILAQPLYRRCRHFPILWGITHTVGNHPLETLSARNQGNKIPFITYLKKQILLPYKKMKRNCKRYITK